jgi:hypothetical protein
MRSGLAVALLALAAPLAAHAQKTGDQSRLIFNISGGYAFGYDLWAIGAQPLTLDQQTDLLSLQRNMTGTWTAGLSVIYFGGENLGFTADAALIDARTQDGCKLLSNSGSVKNAEVCASIMDATRSAMAASLSGGVLLRTSSRAAISPYARLQAGVYFGSVNTVFMRGSYTNADNEPVLVNIYTGGAGTYISPEGTLGAGVTIPVAKAYHLRFEGRATMHKLQIVNGATVVAGAEPPIGSRWVTDFSLQAGIDLVLERRRGRRY